MLKFDVLGHVENSLPNIPCWVCKTHIGKHCFRVCWYEIAKYDNWCYVCSEECANMLILQSI
jgi:hypothetical protein